MAKLVTLYSIFIFYLLPIVTFGGPPKLELTLSISKNEIVQFEPVVVTARVTNISPKAQEIPRAFDRRWRHLKIHLVNPEGKHIGLYPPGIVDGVVKFMELPSSVDRKAKLGNSVHHNIVLTPSPGSWMDTPGDYELYATFNYSKDKERLRTKQKTTVGVYVTIHKGV